MDSFTILVLGLYLLYYLLVVLGGAVALWAASKALDFKYNTFRKALRLVAFYMLIITVPMFLVFFVLASNVDMKFDESSLYPFAAVVALMHLMFLLMIKNSYEEKWPGVLVAYVCYSIVILCLALAFVSLTDMTGFALWKSESFSLHVDWDVLYKSVRGVGNITMSEG